MANKDEQALRLQLAQALAKPPQQSPYWDEFNRVMKTTGDYWAKDNAEFDKTDPSFLGRVGRGLNPVTGFGSTLGSMQDAAGQGDVMGMLGATVGSIPLWGKLKTVATPGVGLVKEGTKVIPDLVRMGKGTLNNIGLAAKETWDKQLADTVTSIIQGSK